MPSSKTQLLYKSCASASPNAYFLPTFRQTRVSAPKSWNKQALNWDALYLICLPNYFVHLRHPCEWYRQNVLASSLSKQRTHVPSSPLLCLLINALESLKIGELVGFWQTHELTLPNSRQNMSIALKTMVEAWLFWLSGVFTSYIKASTRISPRGLFSYLYFLIVIIISFLLQTRTHIVNMIISIGYTCELKSTWRKLKNLRN